MEENDKLALNVWTAFSEYQNWLWTVVALLDPLDVLTVKYHEGFWLESWMAGNTPEESIAFFEEFGYSLDEPLVDDLYDSLIRDERRKMQT